MSFLKHLLPAWKRRLDRKDKGNAAILGAISEQLQQAEREAIESKVVMSLQTSTGEWLDEFGDLFGLVRRDLESDEVYRERIINYITLERGTIPALIDAIRNFLEDYESHITIYEPYIDVFTLNSSNLNSNKYFVGDYYRYAVIDVQFTKPFPIDILEIINEFKPAGVKVYLSYYPSQHTNDADIIPFPIEVSEAKEFNRKINIMNGLHDRIYGHIKLTDRTPEQSYAGDLFTLNSSRVNSQDRLTGSFAAWHADSHYHKVIYSTADIEFDKEMGPPEANEAFRRRGIIESDNALSRTYRNNNIRIEDNIATLQPYDLHENKNLLIGTTFQEEPLAWGVESVEIIEGVPNAIRIERDNSPESLETFALNDSLLNTLASIGGGEPTWGMVLQGNSPLEAGKRYTLKFRAKISEGIPAINSIQIIETGQDLPIIMLDKEEEWAEHEISFISNHSTDSFSLFLGFAPERFPELDGGQYVLEDYEEELDGGSYTDVLLEEVDGGRYLHYAEFSHIHMEEGEGTFWKPAPEDGLEWYPEEGEVYVRPIDLTILETYINSRFEIKRSPHQAENISVEYSYNGFSWYEIEDGSSLDMLLGQEFSTSNLYIRVRMQTDNRYTTPQLDKLAYYIEGKHFMGSEAPSEFYQYTGELDGYYATQQMQGQGTEYMYFIIDSASFLEYNYEDYLKEIANRSVYTKEHYLEILGEVDLIYNIDVTNENTEVKKTPQVYNLETGSWDNLTEINPKVVDGVTALKVGTLKDYLTEQGVIFFRFALEVIEGTPTPQPYEFNLDYFEIGFTKHIGTRETSTPYLESVSSSKIVSLYGMFEPDRMVYKRHLNNKDIAIDEDMELLEFKYKMITPRRAIYDGGSFNEKPNREVSGGEF